MRASAPLQAKACALRPAILRRAPAKQRSFLSKNHTASRMEGRRRRAHHAAVGGTAASSAARPLKGEHAAEIGWAPGAAPRGHSGPRAGGDDPTPTPSCLRRGA